jgi:nucleotide-binding universal stress UspA family protein
LSLTLMRVLPGEPLAGMRARFGASSEPEQNLREAVCRQLRELADEFGSDRQLSVTIEAAAGSPYEEILRSADRLQARLLVLGARGIGFLRRLMLGTPAGRLVRRTDRPLLVVRQAPQEPYRRVLVAIDFSPWSRGAGVDADTMASYRQQARNDAQQRLFRLAEQAGLRPAQ